MLFSEYQLRLVQREADNRHKRRLSSGVRLSAGFKDALTDYMANCPDQLLQMGNARHALVELFAKVHPVLPSPEDADPAPFVRRFFAAVLPAYHTLSPVTGNDAPYTDNNPRRSSRLRREAAGGAPQ